MIRPVTAAPETACLIGPGKIKCLNGRLTFSRPNESALRLDLNHLKTLVCFGAVSLSDEAVTRLLNENVATVFLSGQGFRCRGRLVGLDDGTLPLRLRQYDALRDPHHKLKLARRCVVARLQSQADAARHYQRHQQQSAGPAGRTIRSALDSARAASSIESLRGYEGSGTVAWFSLMSDILGPNWIFNGRNRRPPRDPVNSLISIGSMWLFARTLAAIQAAGLEPALGALHEFRSGRMSLACDLMEPFRAPAVERWVIQLCSEARFGPDEFQADDQHGVRLPRDRFAETMAHWERYFAAQNISSLIRKEVEFVASGFRNSSASRTIATHF